MKKWLYAAAAVLALVAFWILGGPERRVKKLTGQRDVLVLEGSKRAKAKAKKMGIQADKHQANAVNAAEAGKAVIDKVGTNGESMRDLLDSWRKPADSV